MSRNYESYESALEQLNLKSLSERKTDLHLTFAKRTLQNNKVKHMFPKTQENRSEIRRKTEFYHVNKANTERLQMSAIPQMQHLLNKAHKEKKRQMPH